MKIICPKAELVSAVGNISRSVSTRSTIPALEGILIQTTADGITLTGYDLELGMTTSVAARILEAGSIVLSAKLLNDMVRRMPGDEISISSDEKLLTLIKSGATEFTILGIPPEEYPEMPTLSDVDVIEIDQLRLKSMIDQTIFAVAVGDSKPVHTGCLFDIKKGLLTVVAVDGFRLAIRKEPLAFDAELSFIVPSKALAEVSKLIGDTQKPMSISRTSRHIVFDVNGYSVVSRLLEGDFLDYGAAVPKNHSTLVTVSVREFASAIERTSLLISDRLKSPLRLQFEDGLTKIACQTAIGKAYDEIPCKIEGSGLEMGFNNKYLLDALKYSGCDEVKLEISGPLSPMKVVPCEGDAFLFLVLPVRLKTDA